MQFNGFSDVFDKNSSKLLEVFTPGSVYARLSNAKAKSIFKKPIKKQIDNEKYLLKNLREPLTDNIINNFIKKFIQIVFTQTLDTPSSLNVTCSNVNISTIFDNFLEYLTDQYFPHLMDSPPPDLTRINLQSIKEIMEKMQSIAITDLRLSQLTILGDYVKTLLFDELRDTCRSSFMRSQTSAASPDRDLITLLTRKLKKTPLPINCNQESYNQTPTTTSSIRLARPFDASSIYRTAFDFDNQLQNLLMRISTKQARDELCLGKVAKIRKEILSPDPQIFYGRLFSIENEDPNSNAYGILRDSMRISSGHGYHSGDNQKSLSTNIIKGSGHSIRNCHQEIIGSLAGHLHEHRMGSIKLTVHPRKSYFISASNGDGLIKYWSFNSKLTSNNMENKSNVISNTLHGQEFTNGIRYLPYTSSLTIDINSEKYSSLRRNSDDTFLCQGCTMIDRGDQIAALYNRNEMIFYDFRTGDPTASLQFERYNIGKITSFSGAFTTGADAQRSQAQLSSPGGSGGHNPLSGTTMPAEASCNSDWNFLAFSSSTNVLLYDSRCNQSEVTILKQSQDYGLVNSIALHSNKSWLVTGTTKGYLIFSDLRYRRQIKVIRHPAAPQKIGIKSVKILEIPNGQGSNSSLILVGHSKSLELSIYDAEMSNENDCRPLASASIDSPRLSMPRQSMNVLLPQYLNSNSSSSTAMNSALHFPDIISAGTDCHIRNWKFSSLTSNMIAWSGFDEKAPPKVSNRPSVLDNRIVEHVEYTESLVSRLTEPSLTSITRQLSPKTSSTSKMNLNNHFLGFNQRNFSIKAPTHGHVNSITDLAMISTPNNQTFLVSSSADGIIKFWH